MPFLVDGRRWISAQSLGVPSRMNVGQFSRRTSATPPRSSLQGDYAGSMARRRGNSRIAEGSGHSESGKSYLYDAYGDRFEQP